MTNVKPGETLAHAPINSFGHQGAFPPLNFKLVARPNFDTLYSWAWLDLSKEPMIVSVPETAGRYYLLAMMDLWSDVFAVVGTRTTGTEAGHYALVAPGWRGQLPAGVARIDAPTPTVWLLGRTLANGVKDYAAAHAVQAGYHLTPLSQWGGETHPQPATFDPSIDMKTPPPRQVALMPAQTFFTLGMALLHREGAHLADQPILARMRRIGLSGDEAFDFSALPLPIRQVLERAAAEGLQLTAVMKSSMGHEVNGWRVDTDTMGMYGTSYLKRAIVARILPAANLPEDAVYPSTSVDVEGAQLDGRNRSVIRFEPGQLPPVDAFWSITLYDSDGYAVENPLERYAIGDRDGLVPNADGSLEIMLAAADPGPDKRTNWLPAPAGPFNLVMRLYSPKRSVIDGSWQPPGVRRQP
jgi:hypothetical protein